VHLKVQFLNCHFDRLSCWVHPKVQFFNCHFDLLIAPKKHFRENEKKPKVSIYTKLSEVVVLS
jgi:hypothetical protein